MGYMYIHSCAVHNPAMTNVYYKAVYIHIEKFSNLGQL